MKSLKALKEMKSEVSKMGEIAFTKDQQNVIDNPIGNLLVSAAAGSGKTAVLAQRIVDMVLDEEKNIDIDRVLIVTFAKDAAAEMKSRIAGELRKRALVDRDNKRIKRQMTLIHNANISTIDSFCNYIVNNHAGEIGIDSNIRIATEDELSILIEDALMEVIEEYFEQMTPEFTSLVEANAPTGKLDGLKDNIKKIYYAAIAQPFPKQWLMEHREKSIGSKEEFANSEYVKEVVKFENLAIEELIEEEKALIEYTNRPGAFKNYEEALYNDIQFFESLLTMDIEQRFIKIKELKYARKPNPKDACPKDVDKLEFDANVKYVDDHRQKIKNHFKEKVSKFYELTFDTEYNKCVKAKESLNTYIDIVISYIDKIGEKKKEKGVMDFNDMEHYALEILVDIDKEGQFIPSKTARDYSECFDEIMVDEYQDSSVIQEVILSSIAKESGNRFMVGDVKQSIYGFRLARPDIFLGKYKSYSEEPGKDRKIILSKNFRSRIEVIDSVNDVFSRLMKEDIGGIEYDDSQKLYLGAEYYPKKELPDNKTELLYFDAKCQDIDAKNKGEMEALLMAIRIKELVGSFMVYDKESKILRPAEYRDIVILYRSPRGQDIIVKKVFEEHNIPVYVSSKNGYFDAVEIKLLLNYISVLANSRVDIPLYGIMHNECFGGFSEEEMAIICHGKKKRNALIDMVRAYADNPESNQAIVNKIKMLLSDIESFRTKALHMDTEELLCEICDKYKYFDYLSVLPTGDQRVANVKQLIDVAKDYKNTCYLGFYDFVRYVDELKARELDMGEANVFDDKANVVRIMTMHKSKGLEFPITFLGRMDGKFVGRKDDKGISLKSDPEMGFGIKYVDLDRRTKDNTYLYRGIKSKRVFIEAGEEIRVLYVAMTRAKEKLIMVGAADPLKYSPYEEDRQFSNSRIMKADCFMDYIFPIAAGNDNFIVADYTDRMREIETIEAVDRMAKRSQIEEIAKLPPIEFFHYPHADLNMLFNKTSVSELKKAAYEEKDEGAKHMYSDHPAKTIPAFIMQKDKLSGATQRGTAYHRVFEIIDYKTLYDEGDIRGSFIGQRDRFLDNYYISRSDYSLVNEDQVLGFLNTDIARRMAVADKQGMLYREQPFVIGIDSGRLNKDYPSGETIMIQGVIDVFFEENGELVLLDYKTDKVTAAEELINRYKVQLDYYSEALEKLLKKKVKEKLIFSLALSKTIVV